MGNEPHMTLDELLVELGDAVDTDDHQRVQGLVEWGLANLPPEDHARIAAFAAQKAAHEGEVAEFAEEGADALAAARGLIRERWAVSFDHLLGMDLTADERLVAERAIPHLRGG